MKDIISKKDRDILRERAKIQLEYANSEKNLRILKKWEALGKGIKDSPTVRLLFSNFPSEVIHPRLRCEGERARQIEASLLSSLVGRELFDDDTPISPSFDISYNAYARPFGIDHKISYPKEEGGIGFHIDPVIDDLAKDFDKLKGGSFGVDRKTTEDYLELVGNLIGDILAIRMVMPSLTGAITNPLVHLMGMEEYYISMYDYSDELHELMDMATRIYEDFYDFLEEEKLLLPTVAISPLAQESFAFTDELPSDNVTRTTECWGFLESQETTAVSKDMFGEFVFPYQDRLVKRYGLLSYGCCERVDDIFPDYLSKWENLRKLSVSPFNDEKLLGDYLRGSRIVYYSKPRAEHVTNPGPIDEDEIRDYFKEVSEAASGCLFEVAQREVGTIFGDFNRGKRYVELARETIDRYWKP